MASTCSCKDMSTLCCSGCVICKDSDVNTQIKLQVQLLFKNTKKGLKTNDDYTNAYPDLKNKFLCMINDMKKEYAEQKSEMEAAQEDIKTQTWLYVNTGDGVSNEVLRNGERHLTNCKYKGDISNSRKGDDNKGNIAGVVFQDNEIHFYVREKGHKDDTKEDPIKTNIASDVYIVMQLGGRTDKVTIVDDEQEPKEARVRFDTKVYNKRGIHFMSAGKEAEHQHYPGGNMVFSEHPLLPGKKFEVELETQQQGAPESKSMALMIGLTTVPPCQWPDWWDLNQTLEKLEGVGKPKDK